MQKLSLGVFNRDIVLYNAFKLNFFYALKSSYAVFRMNDKIARSYIRKGVYFRAFFEFLFAL